MAFSKFYRGYSTEKYSVSLKTLPQQGISKPEFYGDLVYRFWKIVGKSSFSEQFRKPFIKELAIAWISYGRLHAWLSAQSLLLDMLYSLIARRRFGPQTQWRPLRKTLTSGMGLASGPRVKLASCKSALTPPPPPRCFTLLTVLRRWSRC